jgi:hypothetical protein
MTTKAIAIVGTNYTVSGTVSDIKNNEGVVDLHVLLYDQDVFKDDFLGIGVTDKDGKFSISFTADKFQTLHDKKPDLYFVVKDAGFELLNTKDHVIRNADEDTAAIHLVVDLTGDKLRELVNEEAVPGWVGGFEQSNAAFAYPEPDLSSLEIMDNMDNIDLLQRQQKVLWPEFSWKTRPESEGNSSRCYQMFAPDISRLGYTNEGRIYSIICPQQGVTLASLGCLNVEVTVTGNRGWANETTRELAADMGVQGKIWFSPSAEEMPLVKLFEKHFKEKNLPFPHNKANAIVIETFTPGKPDEPNFPLYKGLCKDFPIPDFAKHEGIAWSVGHLGVQIGAIVKTGYPEVDDFNQMVLDLFNLGSGNMLKKDNILTWNVWFTAPELVDVEEWRNHALLWRESLQADHGSPEGPGTSARYFDGTQFEPVKDLLKEELPRIIHFAQKHDMQREMPQIALYVKEDTARIKAVREHYILDNFIEKYLD